MLQATSVGEKCKFARFLEIVVIEILIQCFVAKKVPGPKWVRLTLTYNVKEINCR